MCHAACSNASDNLTPAKLQGDDHACIHNAIGPSQTGFPRPLTQTARAQMKTNMFHPKLTVLFLSLVFGTWAHGQSTSNPGHSCPTAVEYTGTAPGTNETFHRFDLLVLQQKMRTKSELDEMTAFLEKCVDPRKGSYYDISYPADNNYWGEKEYTYGGGQQFVCNTAENRTTITESRQIATKLRLAAYKCHQAAGWPTATDYVPPAPKPVAMPVPAPRPEPKVPQFVATSPEERLQHCQNEAYVQGVTGDQRKAFMTACIKSAAANTRKDNNSKQSAYNVPSEPNASVQDWPTNQPNTAPFINPKCVDIKQTGKGISDMFKTVYNNCTAPVQVLFCFEDRKNPGRDCKNSDVGWGTTSTIRPGRSTQVSAVPTSWTVHYMVCDMHNPKLLCVRPQ